MNSPLLLMALAVLAGCAWAFLGLSYKMAERTRCRTQPFGLVFTLFGGLLMLGRSFTEHSTWQDPRLWLLGIAIGVMLFVGLSLALRAYALGSAAMIWMVINLALLLPIVLSNLIFHEALYWIDGGILLLFALMLVAFLRGSTTPDDAHPSQVTLFLLVLLTMFICNGLTLFGGKVKDELFHQANSGSFSAIMYLSCAAMLLLALIVRERRVQIEANEWRAGLCAGLSSGLGFFLFLLAASLPAIVVLTLSQGISLLGGILLTTLIYHEQFNGWKSAGLALGLLIFLLVGFREPLANAWPPHAQSSQAQPSVLAVQRR